MENLATNIWFFRKKNTNHSELMEGSSCCKQLFPPPFTLISLSLSWSILKNSRNFYERLGLQYCNTSKNITFSPSGLIGSKHHDYLDQKKCSQPTLYIRYENQYYLKIFPFGNFLTHPMQFPTGKPSTFAFTSHWKTINFFK